MSGDGSNSPALSSSSSNTPVTLEGTSDGIDLLNSKSPQPASSWLDDILRNDSTTVYTYHSTWSSNYTMSNIAGPGRLLGNLLSSTGLTLERRVGKLAYRAGLGAFSKAEEDLLKHRLKDMLVSEETVQQDKACSILFGYARCRSFRFVF